jgi:starch synthase
MNLTVLHVCTEVYPLLKTGGLADVTGALPGAQHGLCDARLLVPGLPALLDGVMQKEVVAVLPARFGAAGARLLRGLMPDGRTVAYVVDCPSLYARPGNPYADASGIPYPDNYLRFALLGWVAARMAQGLDPGWQPCVLHCHDWHAGLAPAYIAAARRATGRALAGTMFTIHNLAYQGSFAAQVFAELGLPGDFYGVEGLEFYGQVSFIKAGLHCADCITTVSPSYAREITTPEQGCGLDGLLRHRARDLHGILNGIDLTVWDPATDRAIAANYSAGDAGGKAACKSALQAELRLRLQDDALLFGIVSRLTDQKGLGLLLSVLPEVLADGAQLVMLGSGESRIEHALQEAAARYPGQLAVQVGFDEAMAHRIMAGSDVVLVPSRFEPCGLTQLYALRYGSLPLVRRVGGLADTVVDTTLEDLDTAATGFVFDGFDAPSLSRALRRANTLWRRPADWARVRERAMRQQFGWDEPARQYAALYKKITP